MRHPWLQRGQRRRLTPPPQPSVAPRPREWSASAAAPAAAWTPWPWPRDREACRSRLLEPPPQPRRPPLWQDRARQPPTHELACQQRQPRQLLPQLQRRPLAAPRPRLPQGLPRLLLLRAPPPPPYPAPARQPPPPLLRQRLQLQQDADLSASVAAAPPAPARTCAHKWPSLSPSSSWEASTASPRRTLAWEAHLLR